MSIQIIREQLGDYAKDLKINLGNVLTEEGSPGLTNQQIYGIALACAYTTKQVALINAIIEDADQLLLAEYIFAAKAAASIMAMNNIYYRGVHLANQAELEKLPAGLRMTVIGKPGIAMLDFELYSLAVSAINGCGKCVESHVNTVMKSGVAVNGVQSTLRIAAVINAVAQALVIN